MKKLLILLLLSLPAHGKDRAIWLPDGRSCTQNSFGQVFGCSSLPDDDYEQPRRRQRQRYDDSQPRFGKTGTLDRRTRYEYNINIYDDYD